MKLKHGEILYKKDNRKEYIVQGISFISEFTINIELPEGMDKTTLGKSLENFSLPNYKFDISDKEQYESLKDKTYISLKSVYGKDSLYKEYNYVAEHFHTLSDLRDNSIDDIID